MKEELTLRDKLAMSMDIKTMPELHSNETVEFIAEKFGLEWSEDPLKQIEFALAYQAIIRYQYADAMLQVRG